MLLPAPTSALGPGAAWGSHGAFGFGARRMDGLVTTMLGIGVHGGSWSIMSMSVSVSWVTAVRAIGLEPSLAGSR